MAHAGCGLVSMVASLLGAEASACEEGAALMLLQHNAATFNSEFSKCQPIRACSFPFSENDRGKFDLVLVTDHLHSRSARTQTLETLLSLLDSKTECTFAHTWRSQATEEAFFKALGQCLVVKRVEGHTGIQRRCSQPLNRSIADSSRDIWEATDEDGSIDIFSVYPHADVPTETWRIGLKELLRELQQEEAEQTVYIRHVASVPEKASAAAVLTDVKKLLPKQGDAESQLAALGSCSTLSSIQWGLPSSIVTSGSNTPAEHVHPAAPPSDTPLLGVHAAPKAPKELPAEKAAEASSILGNSSQTALQDPSLRIRKTEAPAVPGKAAAAPAVASSQAVTPASAPRLMPHTGTSDARAAPRQQKQQQPLQLQQLSQQRLSAAPSSPVASRTPQAGSPSSPSSRPPRSAAVSRATGRPSLGSPPQASEGAVPTSSAAGALGHASPKNSTAARACFVRAAPEGRATSARAAETKPERKAAALTPVKSALAPPGTPATATKRPQRPVAPEIRQTPGAAPRPPTVAEVPGSRARQSAVLRDLPPLVPSVGGPPGQPRRTVGSGGTPSLSGRPATGVPGVAGTLSLSSRPGFASVSSSAPPVKPTRASIEGSGAVDPLAKRLSAAALEFPGASTTTASGKLSSPPVRPQVSEGGSLYPKVAATTLGSSSSTAERDASVSAKEGPVNRGLERQTGSHLTAAGPFGSKLISRLSSLFKRSGSKELGD
ncbi:hypothetical protein Efla_004013 [Eimeria flavescens]